MTNQEIQARLARIESRLVQLMLHVGANPYEKVYELATNRRANHNSVGRDSQRVRVDEEPQQ